MRWKLGGGLAAILMLGAVAGSATSGPAAQRAAWREAYAAPAAIPFPDTNPYTQAKADLGRKLFFDPILSADRDRNRACVTCHLPDLAWADGRKRATSRGDSDMDLRTPSLLNLAWQEGWLGWDGKFRDLEAVAFMPISAPGNMGLPVEAALARLSADAAYAVAFAEAFADPAVTKERIEAALATFQRLIVSGISPFDRWISGDETAIPAAAKRGFDLFDGRANCAACHGGWAFTDGSFHDVGTATGADLGRGRFVPNSQALRYAFKTPGLREVAGRGAYMHDGSLATLDAVIDLYGRGGIARPSRSPEIRPLNLTAADKADLLAFLHTLTSQPGSARAGRPDGRRAEAVTDPDFGCGRRGPGFRFMAAEHRAASPRCRLPEQRQPRSEQGEAGHQQQAAAGFGGVGAQARPWREGGKVDPGTEARQTTPPGPTARSISPTTRSSSASPPT